MTQPPIARAGHWCRPRASLLFAAALVAGCGGSAQKVGEERSPRSAPPAQRPAAFPAQPEGVRFPTRSWPRGAWPAGVDRAAVDDAVDVAFADGGDVRVRAVVIVQGGRLVYERYSPNREDGRRKVMPGFSMSKSLTSALVGTLVKDGRLEVDARAAVREWGGRTDPRREITVDNLLRMSSGLEWDEQRYPKVSDLTRMLASRDAAQYAAAKDLAHEPGTEFQYNTGNTILVDRIMADEVGSRSAFRRFMRARLLDRIGMSPLHVAFDKAGTWLGGVSADTTAQGFAKLGLLYLRDGVWNGERILPEGWVQYSRTPSAANREYGAGWWLDLERPGVFYALGTQGQVMAVAPKYDLTFVLLSTDGRASLPLSEAIMEAFARRR
jgi:CubicO group peptidase (beta-lactamase class C family)